MNGFGECYIVGGSEKTCYVPFFEKYTFLYGSTGNFKTHRLAKNLSAKFNITPVGAVLNTCYVHHPENVVWNTCYVLHHDKGNV